MSPKQKNVLKIAATVGLLAAVVIVIQRLPFDPSSLSPELIRDWVSSFTPWSELVFLGVQMLSVIIAPIPSNVMATAGGLLFGFPKGFLITIASVVIGSSITFGLARLLGQSAVKRFVDDKVSGKYLDLIQRKRDVFLLLTLLFPFFPDDMICILAGLTDIPYRRYLLIVLLARPWGLLFASALGGTAFSLPTWSMVLLGLLLILLFLAGMKYGDQIEEKLLKRFSKS